MGERLKILILEDNPSDAELEQRELRKANIDFSAELVHDKGGFLRVLEVCLPDLILADYSLPGFDGLSAVHLARERCGTVPVIIVSGAVGEEVAIEAVKAGATDYVLKQRLARLGPVVKRAVEEAHQRTAKRLVEEELARQQEWLKVTLSSIRNAVIATDTSGRVAFLNRAAECLTGVSQKEAIARPAAAVFNVVDEVTRKPLGGILARVLESGESQMLPHSSILLTADGRELFIEGGAVSISDPGGRAIGAVLVFEDVSERRRSFTALQQSEEQLRLLAEGVKDYAIFMLSLDGHVISWSSGAERVEGWCADEVLGKHFSLFYRPEEVASGRPEGALAIARREGRFEEEGVRVRKDGSLFWAHVTITPVFDERGEERGFAKVVHDITLQKRAEEALRASEQRLRLVLRASGTGWWEWNFKSDILTGDQKVKELLGLGPDEELSFPRVVQQTLEEDRSELQERARTLQSSAGDYEVEFRARQSDGSYRWLLARGQSFHEFDGVPGMAIGILMDISKRKEIEASLRRSQSHFRRFYESGLLGVISWNMQGEITEANDKFLDMIGYSREDLRSGKINWAHMTPLEYALLDQFALRELRDTGVDTPYEKEYLRKDGTRLPILVGAVMLDEARFEGVAFVLDISERKRLEADLHVALRSAERAKAAAEQANQAKDEFLAVLSHELRTPLTPVLAAVTLMKRKGNLNSDDLLHLELIRRNVSIEARLIDDLLDLTRIVRGKVSLERVSIDICEVLEQVREICRPDIETKKTSLRHQD